MKKLICIMLAAMILIAGCVGLEYPTVLTVDGEDFDTRIYNFFFSTAKLQAESTIDATEIDMYWTTEKDGKTTFDILKDTAYNEMMNVIIAAKTAENAGITYNDETAKMASSFKQEILKGYSNEQEFYEMSNTDAKSFTKIMEMMAIRSQYLQQLSQNGELAASEEDFKRIFETEYMKAKHILFSTMDQATNMPLEQEAIDEKKTLAEAVLARVKGGESFDALMNEYSEDPGTSTNPDGYVFTAGEMVIEFEEATEALALDQVSDLVESQFGYHIIKRLPVSASVDAETFANAQSAIQSTIFTDYLDEKAPTWRNNFEIIENRGPIDKITR